MLALSHGTYHRPLSPIPHGDSFLTNKSISHQAKQILISYVRAEASQYALDLKKALEELKFSVYLVSARNATQPYYLLTFCSAECGFESRS